MIKDLFSKIDSAVRRELRDKLKTSETTKETIQMENNTMENEYTEMNTSTQVSANSGKTLSEVYGTIEGYMAATGKRFRLTKDEKAADLSREEAFRTRIIVD